MCFGTFSRRVRSLASSDQTAGLENDMKKEETKIVDLYDLSHTQAADFLRQFTYPWEALAHIKEFILELGKTLPEDEYEKRGETVWVHKSAKVMPSAYLGENIIIGKDTEVRHCAFLRGNALSERALLSETPQNSKMCPVR